MCGAGMDRREDVRCRNGTKQCDKSERICIDSSTDSGGNELCCCLILTGAADKMCSVTGSLVVHCNRSAVIAEKYDE